MEACDILITGVSGLLGANVAMDWANGRRLAGLYNSHKPSLPGLALYEVNLADPAGATRLEALVRRLNPAVVLHCAAMTNVDQCQRQPEAARQVNALATQAIARASRASGARLAYVSTDAVFGGDRGGYTERDRPAPVNVYAATKLEGERLALEACPDTLVLRTNIFGLGTRPGHGLAAWMLEQARTGKPFPGFTDVVFAPVLVNTLGDVVLACLDAGLGGVWHAAACAPVSKYDFGRALLRAFGLDETLIRPSTAKEAAFAAPRPGNSALDGSRLAARLPASIALDLEAGLARLAHMDGQGRRMPRREPQA